MIEQKKIKILFIHHGTGIGGAPISLLNLIKQLDKSKFDCKVAFIKKSNVIDLFKQEDIKTEIVGSSSLWFTHNETGKIQWRYFYRYLKIYKDWQKTAYKDAPAFLKTQDFDILHLNSHVLTSWAVAGKQLNKKVVLHNREAVAKGYLGIRYKILKKIISKNCDHIINISQDNLKRLGITTNSQVIYNFVSIPNQYRKSMALPDQKRKVLFMGGMARIKGFQTAVDCLPYLDPNITLQFAGNLSQWKTSESFKEKFKNLIKLSLYRSTYFPLLKMYRSKNAEILGLLKEPLPVIDNSDILITPFKIEHFSRPAVEAFAYGKPVIGSDVEGMDEIIDHKVNGLLVEKNNPKALAEAINYLCQHPEQAQAMGQKGRAKAEQVFSPEINTKKVEAIYQKLMAEAS